MKTFIAKGYSAFSLISKYRITLICIIFISCFQYSTLKSQDCKLCSIPSFPELTVYQSFQTAHGMGFGFEAGSWKKDAGKFSYFLGTSLVWSDSKNPDSKSDRAVTKQTFLGLYVKGQYKVANHLYLVASPGIVNLTYLEFQTGLRYVVPLTHTIGMGIEPAYAFNQKQFLVNANLHFALR
jgi:hypothetical protein